jgi:threonine/homoserine/homoserine lactone efflux protein
MFPAPPLLAAFLAASLILAVTPGPGVFYIVTRTLAQGRRAGLASVAGVALGNLGNALGAALGLAALFAISTLAFSVVKYAGAGYLIFLGVRTLRARSSDGQREIAVPSVEPMERAAGALAIVPIVKIARDGCVVALFNPKTALFFAAFLPQFMPPGAAPMQQTMALGALFVVVAAATDTGYALAAGILAPRLARLRTARVAGRYLTAGAFIGLGVYTAAAGVARDGSGATHW